MTDRPIRIRLSRAKGWRLKDYNGGLSNGLPAVKVDRTTRFGNPWTHDDPAIAVAAFRGMLQGDLSYVPGLRIAHRFGAVDRERAFAFRQRVAELRGKNLACWCPLDQPCHADVLLELANAPEAEDGGEA